MWPRSFFSCIAFAFSLAYAGCGSEKADDQLLVGIQQELKLNDPIVDALVFFLTENDCESCSMNTYGRINSIVEKNQSKKLFGIYLSIPGKEATVYDEFIAKTRDKISWTFSKNTTLFGLVSQRSDKHHSPFLITIASGRLNSVLSISKG